MPRPAKKGSSRTKNAAAAAATDLVERQKVASTAGVAAKTTAKRLQSSKIRESLLNLTVPAIRRVLHRAGIKRVSLGVYDAMRKVAARQLLKVLPRVIIYVDRDGRKTIQGDDVYRAFKSLGIHVGTLDHHSGEVADNGKVKLAKKKEAAPGAKPHKFKAGTVAVRKIKQMQKSDAFIFPRASFVRFTRGVLESYLGTLGKKNDYRITASSLTALQLFIEDHLVDIAHAASYEVLHDRRVTLMDKDILLVFRVRCTARGAGCDPALIYNPSA